MVNEEKEILGYYEDGQPICPPQPGHVYTQAFTMCRECQGLISTHGGPRYGSVCLACHIKLGGILSLYEQYLHLRTQCGYDDEGAIRKPVWDACDRESQLNMVAQMRKGAAQVKEMRAKQQEYNERYGEVW